MPNYHIYATITGNKYLGNYKAKTKEIAIELALKKNDYISLCHECSHCGEYKYE